MKKKAQGYLCWKRIFDIVGSLFGLMITSPLLLIAVVGIEISDPGPVFYMANRVGKDNRVFQMFKFRSMRQGIANEAVFRGEEKRIFPFGKFMRASKLDELPQLINILMGTMSFVGPRPAALDQVKITRSGIYAEAGDIPAGLTGPSALYDYIYGDYVKEAKDYEQFVLPTRLKLDLVYLEKMGFWFDIKMIWWTVLCIIAELIHKRPEKILKELTRWAAE